MSQWSLGWQETGVLVAAAALGLSIGRLTCPEATPARPVHLIPGGCPDSMSQVPLILPPGSTAPASYLCTE